MTSSNADLMYFPDDSGPSVDETGLENEELDPIDPITEPFDPEKVDIRTVPVLIGQLVSRIEHREIDLSPEFQRLRGIWDPKRRSRLIESLLLRIPIPVFYVAASEDDAWSVVDGLQRMSTIFDYATGEFTLSNLEYLEVFNGCKYDDLPRLMQRRINETQLIVNVIERGTPRDAMFNVFLRINTGGMTFKPARNSPRYPLRPDTGVSSTASGFRRVSQGNWWVDQERPHGGPRMRTPISSLLSHTTRGIRGKRSGQISLQHYVQRQQLELQRTARCR